MVSIRFRPVTNTSEAACETTATRGFIDQRNVTYPEGLITLCTPKQLIKVWAFNLCYKMPEHEPINFY